MHEFNIEIDEERKVVSIWLPRANKEVADAVSAAKSLIAQYKERYKVVVFMSGERNLTAQTESLLIRNR
ncbi:hypothetical protein FACS1894120_4000 [Clostridia bacterium]|nr:hypothetical protein FACS1894120_4000 [Clostridia bacterium]